MFEKYKEITHDFDILNKKDKVYNIFTKGSFDCVHLGHFILFANIKYEAAKFFCCPIRNIKLTALLSFQDGGKHKNANYLQAEEERKKAVLSTGLVDSVEFCMETDIFVRENLDRIDMFAFGFDQAQTRYFKKIIAFLNENKTPMCILNKRDVNLSSTIVRNGVANNKISVAKSRKMMEENYKLPKKDSFIISLLRLYSFIDDEKMRLFNLSIKNFIGKQYSIYIGGCQATGKTTIAKYFKEQNNFFDRYTSSEAFMEYLGIGKKELEFVNEADPQNADNMLNFIKKNHKYLFLDGHFLCGKKERIEDFSLKIFVNARIEEILKRKMLDTKRHRTDNLTIQKVFGEYFLKLVRACKISDKVFVLDNTGDINSTIKKLNKIIILNRLPKILLKKAKIEFADDLLNKILYPKINRIEHSLYSASLKINQLLINKLTNKERF